MPQLILKPGREKSVLRHHPWIFSGAVASVRGSPAPGDTVEVRSAGGDLLGVAACNPHSRITARMWDFGPRRIDEAFFRARLAAAVRCRDELVTAGASAALRLVHGESDGLPGVIADRYGDTVVLQLNSAGADRWRREILAGVVATTGAVRVWERSDPEARELEGLPAASGPLYGPAEPARIAVTENDLAFEVDLARGHKTGYYLDQRENRRRLRALAGGREVLDCFCYTGAFALNALAGGARAVTAIDSSKEALAIARANAERNGLPAAAWLESDVFQQLRRYRDGQRRFDLVVLDPPKFAPTAAHAPRAARAYKDINLLAFKLLRPGGLLMTFSCSGGVGPDLFQKIVAGAALDAGVRAQIVERLAPGPDHPVALDFPEGDYLKGLLCRVADCV